MKILFTNRHLPENIEILFMLVLGIMLQTTDGSPFTIKTKWTIVWDTELPPENFSQFVQTCIKSILSGIVAARCLTAYAYVLSGMLVIVSILKDSRSQVILMWLLVAGIKSIAVTVIETLTGIYVCSAFGKIRKACVEFFLSKSLEIIFSTYLWASVLNIYHDMERRQAELKKPLNWGEYYKQLDFKRPRTRSLLDESVLCKTALLNNFQFKDVPQIILQMLRKEEETSKDSLLGHGMMLASVSNLGSFDNLQTSQSLGELGLLDLRSVQVTDLEDDENLSPQEKALKFLNLTWNDVIKAKEAKEINSKQIFLANDKSFERITKNSGIRKPKQKRPEIVLQQIPNLNQDEENTSVNKESKKKLVELKWEFSLYRFLQEKERFRAMEEEQVSSTFTFDDEDEEAEEEGVTPLFMSNIKEELAVHRIRLDNVSKHLKGNNYAKLYKEEYMNVVGPEVFDKASKLPKLISLNLKKETRTTGSTSATNDESKKIKKKLMFYDEAVGKGGEMSLVLSEKNVKLKDKIEATTVPSSVENDTEKTNDTNPENINLIPSRSDALIYQNESNIKIDSDKYTERKSIQFKKENYEEYESEIENYQKPKVKNKDESVYYNKAVPKCFSSRKNEQTSSDEKSKDDTESFEPGLCYKKRKIAVIRKGKQNAKPVITIDLWKSFLDSDDRDRSDEEEIRTCKDREKSKTYDSDQSNIESSNKSKGKDLVGLKNKEACYMSQVLLNPFAQGVTSNDGFRSLSLEHLEPENQESHHNSSHTDVPRDEYRGKKTEKKIWKSKVLKTVANQISKIKIDSLILQKAKLECIRNLMKNMLRKKLIKKRNNLINELFLDCQKELNNYDEVLMWPRNFMVYDQENFKFSPLNVQNETNIKTSQSNSEKVNFAQDFSNDEQKFSNSERFAYEHKTNVEKFRYEPSESQVIKSWMNTAFTNESNVNHRDETSSKDSETKICEEDFFDSGGSTLEESPPEFKNVESPESIKITDLPPLSSGSENPLKDTPRLQDSEESFSLYYSKTADLASPLLDMRRFIYPDHIHYSYKHVKKKGFDVDINGGLPLLVRESLTMNDPVNLENVSTLRNPESGIIRRPMDLSFALSSAEWQNQDQDRSNFQESKAAKDKRTHKGRRRNKNKSQHFDSIPESKVKSKKWRKTNNFRDNSAFESKSKSCNPNSFKPYERDNYLIEKLLKMWKKINNEKRVVSLFDESESERPPIQISSTQLHSNKGRINSTYNPAIFLNKNKTRCERRKAETQEERTKDMFARLEREILLQSKNLHKGFGLTQHS